MNSSIGAEFPKDPIDSVVEEMAELTKELMKSHRFGLFSEWNGEVNIDRIRAEMQDVAEALSVLHDWLNNEEHATFNQT
jgi:hypothetical protein